jgi:ribonuclease HI
MKVWTDASRTQICIVNELGGVSLFQHGYGNAINRAEADAILVAITEYAPVVQMVICTDSEVFIRQFTGMYRIKDNILKELHNKIQEECRGRNISFQYVPREENRAGHVLEEIKRSK